ncbi:MAG: hypothetical protein BWZ11_01885 [Bacteroidetes bacterium ADurb.BinA395]|nr:MAG: hypothetical protein BWZ11_01885 [Bacteroidetes bacterium ADurb.BinA395]
MKTNYEKQAADFLEKTGCKMTITYKENRKYFPNDEETRDVYEVKIERGSRVWKFEFGNSIKDSEFVAVYGKTKYPIPASFREKSNSEIALYVKQNLQSDFGTVKADRIIRPVPPSEYSILACLTKYDPESFEDFCSEFGYDTDSKKADKVYSGVKEEWLNVCRMWSDSEIEELCEIQ